MENVIDIPKSLASFIRFVKERKVLVILSIILMSALVSFFYTSRKMQYQGEITILSSKVPFQFIEYIVKPIENAIQNREYDELSRILATDIEKTEIITGFQIEEIKGLQNLDFKNGFTIIIESQDRDALEPFGSLCAEFLNQNEFINEWKKVYTDNLNELEKTTEIQISRLDSVQKMIPGIISNYKAGSIQQQSAFDIGTIYDQMVDLKDKREKLIREIKFNREFKVISTSFFQKKAFGNSVFFLALIIFNVATVWAIYLLTALIERIREHL